MRLHRFFSTIPLPKAGEFIITDENLLNQWRNVLRLEAGSRVILFDGSGDEALCELRTLSKKEATALVLEYREGLKPPREVTLFLSLIKRDNFELVLEKATELGVSRIVPVEAARSEKKGINRERSEKILREAAEQSGRATVPILDEAISLQDVFKKYQIPLVAFDPRGDRNAREYFNALDCSASHQVPDLMHDSSSPGFGVGILIGPEGGFTEDELALFPAHSTPVVTTGPTILRAETAAVVALTLALVV